MSVSKPSETYQEDTYTFDWPDEGVTAVIERFQESRDDVRAELTVNSDHPTSGGQLYFGRLLLMGPQARAQVRNALEKRNQNVDWGGMLEQICTLALRRYREGAPPVDLWADSLNVTTRYLLRPFLFADAVNLIYGAGDSGKSLFTLALALCVATGQEVAGMVPERVGPVLYLDWEDSAATHQERLKGLAAAIKTEVPPNTIIYRRMDASLKESVREVRKDVARIGAQLVIVDSVGMACGGDPSNAEAVIQTMLAARSLNVVVAAVHHVAKFTKAENKSSPYGSVYASNEARNSWLVESEREAGRLEMVLTNHKSNRGERAERQSFRLAFHEDDQEVIDSITITSTDFTESKTIGAAGQKWVISEVLKGGRLEVGPPDTEGTISALTGFPAATVRAVLNKASNKHLFTHFDDGWGLASPMETEPVTKLRGTVTRNETPPIRPREFRETQDPDQIPALTAGSDGNKKDEFGFPTT